MRLISRLVVTALVFLLIGCEQTPDMSGTWIGKAEAMVDAEKTTIDVEMDIEQTEADVSGSVYWGPIEATISSAEFSGPQLVLVSEWPEGSITFRGFATDNTFKGRFSIKHSANPQPFQGAIELTKE